MVSMRSEKPICAPPRLSEVSPTLALKRFQFSSDCRWPLKSHKTVSTNHDLFKEKGEPKRNRAEALLIYQPNALPLGQTDSLMLQSEDSNPLIDPFRLSRCRKTTTSQSTTKFYNSSKAGVGRNVLTLTSCVLRSDRTESVWMPTDLV